MWLRLAADGPWESLKSILFERGHPPCYVKLHARNINFIQLQVNERIIFMLKQH